MDIAARIKEFEKDPLAGYEEINYKGHAIMKDLITGDFWTVQLLSDEIICETVEEAKS